MVIAVIMLGYFVFLHALSQQKSRADERWSYLSCMLRSASYCLCRQLSAFFFSVFDMSLSACRQTAVLKKKHFFSSIRQVSGQCYCFEREVKYWYGRRQLLVKAKSSNWWSTPRNRHVAVGSTWSSRLETGNWYYLWAYKNHWCKQDQILKTKTKTTGSKEMHLADLLLSKWTPLLISTVVMFQAQNRETINSTWKVAVFFKIIMTMSVTRLFHNTTSDLQDQGQGQDRFLLFSDRSCPKTDRLVLHHWHNNASSRTRYVTHVRVCLRPWFFSRMLFMTSCRKQMPSKISHHSSILLTTVGHVT